MYVIYFVILIIICWIIYKYFSQTHETFGDVLNKYNPYDYVDVIKQFSDVVEYKNEVTGLFDTNKNNLLDKQIVNAYGRTGFDQCIEKCNGYCVEYGLTGDAHCYKIVPEKEKVFNADVVQNDTNLAYPNINRT